MNRITAAIARKTAEIAARIESGKTTQAQADTTAKALDLDLGEYVKFQELKSLAVANEKLTLDEGQTIYALLGNTPSVFNKQPIAVKAVLTGLFGELLKAHISAARR